MVSELFSPYEELHKLKAVTKSQEEEIASLKAKVDELKREIKGMVINRSEASFEFELADVSKFFEIENNRQYSDKFWCRGLQWSIYVQYDLKKSDSSKQLGFYLRCENDDEENWWCEAKSKLFLFNNLPQKENYVRGPCSDIFEKKNRTWGYLSFISYSELTDEKNGYIKNDKIVLGVEMKAKPVVRMS